MEIVPQATAAPVLVPPMNYEILAGTDVQNPARFSVGKLLGDPNFQQLLAGLGASFDPKGFAGMLGGLTQAAIRNKAAQSALEQQEAKSDTRHSELLDILRTQAGLPTQLTPKGTPGYTSISRGKDGSYKVELDPPAPNTPENTAPSRVTGATTTGGMAPERTTKLSNIIPFY